MIETQRKMRVHRLRAVPMSLVLIMACILFVVFAAAMATAKDENPHTIAIIGDIDDSGKFANPRVTDFINSMDKVFQDLFGQVGLETDPTSVDAVFFFLEDLSSVKKLPMQEIFGSIYDLVANEKDPKFVHGYRIRYPDGDISDLIFVNFNMDSDTYSEICKAALAISAAKFATSTLDTNIYCN